LALFYPLPPCPAIHIFVGRVSGVVSVVWVEAFAFLLDFFQVFTAISPLNSLHPGECLAIPAQLCTLLPPFIAGYCLCKMAGSQCLVGRGSVLAIFIYFV